jgi:hypothetical protein
MLRMIQIKFGFTAAFESPLAIVGALAEPGEIRSAKFQKMLRCMAVYHRREITPIGKLQHCVVQREGLSGP